MYESGKTDMEEALRAISSMSGKTQKAKDKFAQGTPQHTLQKNRFQSLSIASSLISKQLAQTEASDCYSEEELKKSTAPIASLISKSEKALGKLTQGTWQHTMLKNNIEALHIASSVLMTALCEMSANNERTK